jgi:hypothetical protein
MRTFVDDRLRLEAERHALRYSCEHCAHFDVVGRGCAEGYPNTAHRERAIDGEPSLEFCKSFELA